MLTDWDTTYTPELPVTVQRKDDPLSATSTGLMVRVEEFVPWNLFPANWLPLLYVHT